MVRILLALLISGVAKSALAQDEPTNASSLPAVREVMRAVEEDSGAVLQRSRETLDLILRAPLVATWKSTSVLADVGLRGRAMNGDSSPLAGGSTWSMGLDAVVSESVELLGEIIAHGRWSVVHAADPPDLPCPINSPTVQASMSIPLSMELPVEARLGIETDSVHEDYFVISTELGNLTNPLEAKWLAWSTRLDYRSSVESPSTARAEQRVGLRLGRKDTIGVTGRIEDRNLAPIASPFVDLAPAGEVFWNHHWLNTLESSFKVQQVLPDLQSLWLSEPGGSVQVEANLRAALNTAARVDVLGTTTQDLSQFGIRLQLEFLLGVPTSQPPERIMAPEGDGERVKG